MLGNEVILPSSVLLLAFRSIIYQKQNFTYSTKQGSVFLHTDIQITQHHLLKRPSAFHQTAVSFFNAYNLMCLNICMHPHHHHNQGNKHIHHLQKILLASTLYFVVRTCHLRSTFLTNLSVHNTKLLTIGTRQYIKSLEFIYLA